MGGRMKGSDRGQLDAGRGFLFFRAAVVAIVVAYVVLVHF